MLKKLLPFLFTFTLLSLYLGGNTNTKYELNLQLKWYHQFQFAGYYAALEKGYYSQKGIQVNIKAADYKTNVLDEVLSGNADIGITGPDILKSYFEGQPIVVLGAIMQHSPLTIITLKESGISTPHDLIGKSIMLSNSRDLEVQMMLRNEGVKNNVINIQKHSWNIQDLILHNTDAISAYITNEPFLFPDSVNINTMMPVNYGVDFYGDCLFSTQYFVEKEPELISNFIDATKKGWVYALNNKEEIADLIVNKYGSAKSKEALLYEANQLVKLINPALVEVGHMNPWRWNQIAQVIQEIEGLKNTPSLNDFIYSKDNYNTNFKQLVIGIGIVLIIALCIIFILYFFNKQLNKKVIEVTKNFNDSKEKYKLLIDNINDLICEIDENGCYTFLSDNYKEIMGYNPEDLIGTQATAYIHPDDLKQSIEKHAILQKTESKSSDTWRFKHKNGKYRYIESKGTIYTNSKQEKRTVVISRDITDRVINEKQLINAILKTEENEAKLKKAQAIAKFGSWEYNVATDSGIWSDEMFKIFGRDKDKGSPGFIEYMNYILPEFRELIKSNYEKIINEESGINTDFKIKTDCGEIKWINQVVEFVKKDSENEILLMGTSSDITERKKAEAALKEAKDKAEKMQQLLSNITENMFDMVSISDYQGNFTFVSNSHQILGYTKEELIGRNFFEYIHPDEKSDITKQLANLIQDKDTPIAELRFKTPNGGYLWIETMGKVLNDRELLFSSREITDRKRHENELKQAKETAEENSNLKTAFLQNMSHEIRTPMNAIVGFSKIINKPNLKPNDLEKFTSIIQNSSQQLLAIITDILTISSLDTKQVKVNLEAVNVNTVIVELLAIFKQQMQTKNIKLIANTNFSDEEASILTDKTKFIQVLSNLLTNASKFTLEGSIEVGYDIHNKSIEFYVKDTGIGIKPEDQNVIFERFRQIEHPLQSEYRGTGLGLCISSGFIELLKGQMWVDSTIDKGSTFYFTLPYNKVIMQQESIKNKNPMKEKHILIAEDEEFNYIFLQQILKDQEYKLIHVNDGIKAIEAYKNNTDIDLILMDIKMPNLNGFEAAKQIKELSPDLPIIAQSAYALEHEVKKYKEVFDDYITKPINENLLLEIVEKYLK